MAIAITTTYSGEVRKDLLIHSMTGNDTVDKGLVHFKNNIQHKFVLPTMKLGNIIQDNVPTPSTSVGTYTFGERYLEPNDFMVYTEFNPRDFEEMWRPFQPKGNLVFRKLNPKIQTAMLRQLIARKNQWMGSALWMSTKGGLSTGYTAPSGETNVGDVSGNKNKYWDGYLARLLTSAADDPDGEKVIISGTTAMDTGAKVEAALYAAYKKCPKAIRGSKKLKFVLDYDLWDLYDEYLSSKDNKYTENKDVNDYRFKGKQIVPVNGFPAQTIVLGEFGKDEMSNFWVGVDYSSDTEVIKVDKLQSNSELYFFQMRMKTDVNFCKPGEIVMHTAYVKA